MKTIALFLLCLGAVQMANAGTDNCSAKTSSWKSEKEALVALENMAFLLSETFVNDSTSWLLGAAYYSCDGKNGYLVVQSNQKEFVHASVPVEVWQDLRKARSKGGFYNFYIKNKFPFQD